MARRVPLSQYSPGATSGVLNPTGRMGRVMRNPRHSFIIEQRPFEITPFLIAPVLPGETLKNLLWQARAVTKPIKNPLVGWWLEYYLFYVKMRDLDARDTLTAMLIDPSTSIEAIDTDSATTWTYAFDESIDFTQLCLERVVAEWFRDEGELWNDFTITAGRPAAKINSDTWLDSVVDRTILLDPDDPDITVGVDDQISASEIDTALRQWEFLRSMNLTAMDYEDFLATFGIKQAAVDLHRPELIRYSRDWQYPSNTVNPSDGAPTSAVSWSISERADKNRFFREHGFIFGVTVARPKVYLEKQTGSGVGMLTNSYSWLPAIMSDDPRTSLREFAAGTGPLPSATNAYVVDLRDLFLYGDQFVNFALTEADMSIVDLPNAALTNKKYPTSAEVDLLFTAASPANIVTQDGVVSMAIAGTQIDTTPGSIAGA